jgi:hypothetical protein
MGWWWVIGPAWYLYPAPIYPYPDPDLEVLVYDDTVVPDAAACREFHGDAIINDTGAPFYGTACLEPDGLWHIVSS